MYDLHTHILPGIDDGPGEWDTAVRMLKTAVNDGIRGIVATPHVTPGLHDNTRCRVMDLVGELRNRAEGLPISIYAGSELAVSIETLSGIASGRCCTINSGRYALVELPKNFSPKVVYDFIFKLTVNGIVPVVAHPERNSQIVANTGILYEMVRMGALGQVTAGSLTGYFGTEIKKAAGQMLMRRLLHVIASDAHSDECRPPELSAAVRAASKISGEAHAGAMVGEIPKRILENKLLRVPEPVHVTSFYALI